MKMNLYIFFVTPTPYFIIHDNNSFSSKGGRRLKSNCILSHKKYSFKTSQVEQNILAGSIHETFFF